MVLWGRLNFSCLRTNIFPSRESCCIFVFLTTITNRTTKFGVNLQSWFLISIILQFVFNKYKRTRSMFVWIIFGQTSSIIEPLRIRGILFLCAHKMKDVQIISAKPHQHLMSRIRLHASHSCPWLKRYRFHQYYKYHQSFSKC